MDGRSLIGNRPTERKGYRRIGQDEPHH